MLRLGEWELHTVEGGRYLIDAGVMNGIIPRTVWQHVTPPDATNRIPLGVHCVLARSSTHCVLIDTGYGGKLSPLERSSYAIDPGNPVLESLAALGVAPEAIDVVVFSHLHWDHVGGATVFDSDRRPVPTFPRATYFINRLEWEDASSGLPEHGGYNAHDFLPLQQAGQLVLVEGEIEIVPGLWTRPTGGHTRGHQALVLESGGRTALYPGDLCSVEYHLRRLWSSAYELYPLQSRQRKPQLLGEAADGNWWVLWDHDPNYAVSRLERHKTREFVMVDARAAV